MPRVGIDASLVATALDDQGALAVPDFGTAGWYSVGPRPGEPGPAVLAGHVDSRTGPDVFYRLRELEPGDEIRVHRADGTTITFVVDVVEEAAKDQLPVDRIWDAGPGPRLRLITCGGDFDRSIRSYRSNVIVYAAQL